MFTGLLGHKTKRAAEKRMWSFDFSGALAAGETIVGGTVSVTSANRETGIDSSGTMKDGSHVISGAIVSQRWQAGVAGDFHNCTCTLETNLGQILSRSFLLQIVEG